MVDATPAPGTDPWAGAVWNNIVPTTILLKLILKLFINDKIIIK